MKRLIFNTINAMLGVAGVLSLTGCADDPVQKERGSGIIRFSVASGPGWTEVKSRPANRGGIRLTVRQLRNAVGMAAQPHSISTP